MGLQITTFSTTSFPSYKKFRCRAVPTRKVMLRKEETTVNDIREESQISYWTAAGNLFLNTHWRRVSQQAESWMSFRLVSCLAETDWNSEKDGLCLKWTETRRHHLRKNNWDGAPQRASSPMTRRKNLCDIYVISLVWCEMLNAKVYLLERKREKQISQERAHIYTNLH